MCLESECVNFTQQETPELRTTTGSNSFFCFQVQTNLHPLCISLIFHIYDERHVFIFTAEHVTGSLLFASFFGYLNTMSVAQDIQCRML
jgi:hypothetical protein